jgi:hypothetical protein
MKTLNMVFEDKEFKKLQRKKKHLKLTWKKMLMSYLEEEKEQKVE